ncbi:hypothetical protein J437_LFUL012666 [Ladona fulva]|uniref:Uncharacterized protein n=1 Tax=Ladona fulva TaxID=123851 RepID=A0A8K0KCR0_LADFU|nr:hypothetical protein J437_LFUL012666 [Ladona fulva]
MKAEERERLIENIVSHLKDASDFIQEISAYDHLKMILSFQERAVKNFSQVDSEFGKKLREGLSKFAKHGSYATANL